MIVGLSLSFCFSCSGGSRNNKVVPSQGYISKGEKNQEIVFRITNGTEIAGIDPALVTERVEFRVLNSLLEGLIYNSSDSSVPFLGLANEKMISNDGLLYIFKLRDGLKWSDGKPLTADDFVYALSYIGCKAFNNGKGSREDVKVTALNDVILQIELESPVAYFLSSMGHYTLLSTTSTFY